MSHQTATPPHKPFGVATACALYGAAIVASLLGAATIAYASNSPEDLYRQQRASCLSGRAHQERSACLKEAQAALAEARAGRLGNGRARHASDFLRNEMARCAPLRGDDRQDCESRARGEGIVHGSVARGGIYRETHRIVPVEATGADQRMDERMNERMDERKDERMNERMNERKDERKDERMDDRMDQR